MWLSLEISFLRLYRPMFFYNVKKSTSIVTASLWRPVTDLWRLSMTCSNQNDWESHVTHSVHLELVSRSVREFSLCKHSRVHKDLPRFAGKIKLYIALPVWHATDTIWSALCVAMRCSIQPFHSKNKRKVDAFTTLLLCYNAVPIHISPLNQQLVHKSIWGIPALVALITFSVSTHW